MRSMLRSLARAVPAIATLLAPAALEAGLFVRGDSNRDDIVDVSDPVHTLLFLFRGGIAIECLDAADANDDGRVDLPDAVFTLDFLFRGGARLPPPFPDPGLDPTRGEPLTCPPEAPAITFVEPPPFSYVAAAEITVSIVLDPADGSFEVEVNGLLAARNGGLWTVVVPLREGTNTLTAVARDNLGQTATATTFVTADRTPPRLLVRTPSDGFTTSDAIAVVAGMASDLASGTAGAGDVQVLVNGADAQVANGSFLVEVPLELGENVVRVTGRDRAGNTAEASSRVVRVKPPAAQRIKAVAGNNQTAPIGELLPAPLETVLLDATGAPVAGEMVIFKVVEGSGVLSETKGGGEARSLAVASGANGRARARFRLGMRAGAGNHRVEALAVGFAGRALFTASAVTSAPATIHADSGDHQRGAVLQALPHPLVAVVTDRGHNRLGGVDVTFTVVQGGGSFGGAPSVTLSTDSDGRARAEFVLGPAVGIENHVVRADFAGNPGLPAVFSASGLAPADPKATRVAGVILDNTNEPVEGVTVRLVGFAAMALELERGIDLVATTDAAGQFELPAPVGFVELEVDGSTALRPGSWPSLTYELVTVPGQLHTVGQPIYLLPLDEEHGVRVSETEGGIVTLPDLPGFSLEIAPGSATFPGGAREGVVTVTAVHADKVPMVPGGGLQPRLPLTIQPSGTVFDPPAAVTVPNTDGLAPGEVIELQSFDHDLGRFVAIGTGTVSADGSVIRSDPGVGILKAGWYCGCVPQPSTQTGSLHVTLSPAFQEVFAGELAAVTARGRPAQDGQYFSWDVSDPAIAPFQSVPICPGASSCTAELLGAAVGEVEVTVAFGSTTTGQSVRSEPVRVRVLNPVMKTINGFAVDEAQERAFLAGEDLVIVPSVRGVEDAMVTVVISFGGMELERRTVAEGEEFLFRPKEPGEYEIVTIHEGFEARCRINVVDIEFLDRNGEEVALATSFSHPYPVVELEDLEVGDLDIDGNIARVVLRGTVRDALADIVEGGRADIRQVLVTFLRETARPEVEPIVADGRGAGVPPCEAPRIAHCIPVAVTRVKDEPGSGLRPFAFKGTFETPPLEVPLWTGDIAVSVRADNLIGNSGHDSFTIQVLDMEIQPREVEGETIFEALSVEIGGITNHPIADDGSFNPVQIRITDFSAEGEGDVELTARFYGRDFQLLRIGEGRFELDRPVAALAREFPSEIPNLIQAVGTRGAVEYREARKDFFWAYTSAGVAAELEEGEGAGAGIADISEPIHFYKFASGTTVTVYVRSTVFADVALNGLPEPAVGPLEIIGDPVELRGARLRDPGYRIQMRIPPTSTRRNESLVFGLRDRRTGHLRRSMVAGTFVVIPRLKTIIIAVDGLAHAVVLDLLADPAARTFRELFRDAFNRDIPALAAIPTVTWCNWPGIFSGQRPALHGVTGNAFFERENLAVHRTTPLSPVQLTPFASGSDGDLRTPPLSLDKTHGALAGFGELNDRARTASGSLYDRLASFGVREALSVNLWYYKSGPVQPAESRVQVEHSHFPGLKRPWTSLKFHHHDEETAKLLDETAAFDCLFRLAGNLQRFDVISVYQAGPDNIAHKVGADETSDFSERFRPKPPVGEVNQPLCSLADQVTRVTDGTVARILNEIDRNGYRHATLFALVADHGLHAFENAPGFNLVLFEGITQQDGLKFFFSEEQRLGQRYLGHEVWVGNRGPTLEECTLVYAANGGMAQIYIRNRARDAGGDLVNDWTKPPRKEDIERVAGLLFAESTGIAVNPDTGETVNYAVAPCICFRGSFLLQPGVSPGGAFGDPPAIFVRVAENDQENHFQQDYRWVKFADPLQLRRLLDGMHRAGQDPPVIRYGSIGEFLELRGFSAGTDFPWPEFELRLQELNDKASNGSRAGDVLVFTDGRAGYLTINAGDGFHGWHGGATRSESEVPLMFNIPDGRGDVVVEDFIEDAVEAVRQRRPMAEEIPGLPPVRSSLRNWNLADVLQEIYRRLYE